MFAFTCDMQKFSTQNGNGIVLNYKITTKKNGNNSKGEHETSNDRETPTTAASNQREMLERYREMK